MEDLPGDLVRAIFQGNRILDWQENLQEDEMPPEWMWVFEDELNLWFDRVTADRARKFGGSGSDSSDDGTMMQNEYARDRR